MFIESIRIQNFRALEDAEIDCREMVTLIGANGAGKSTILQALVLYYKTDAKVVMEDFFGRQADRMIRITVSFANLTHQERERFGTSVVDGRLAVSKCFSKEFGFAGQYRTTRKQLASFADIRRIEGKGSG